MFGFNISQDISLLKGTTWVIEGAGTSVHHPAGIYQAVLPPSQAGQTAKSDKALGCSNAGVQRAEEEPGDLRHALRELEEMALRPAC